MIELSGDVIIGDTHMGDPDLWRPDINGNRGGDMLRSFYAYAASRRLRVHWNGDVWNARSNFARDLQEWDPWIRDLILIDGVAGNHDWWARNVESLGFAETWRRSFDIKINGFGVSILHEHGSLADAAWKYVHNGDEPKARVRIARTLGDDVIKRGLRAERFIHPMIDEWIMRGLRRAKGIVIPRGANVEDQAMIDLATKRRPTMDAAINTGSWVPSGEAHRDGWYARGEVFPCVFSAERLALFHWTGYQFIGLSPTAYCTLKEKRGGWIHVSNHTHRPFVKILS